MKIAPVADVKARFSAYLDDCQDGPVVVTRNGRPVAVIIGAEDEQDLDLLILSHTPRFRHLLDDAERRVRETGGIGHDMFWERLADADPASQDDLPVS
jgi:prevent-host-death family protein